MSVSAAISDVAMIRPGHVIFANAFSKTSLTVDLPLCLKFVIEHGVSNCTRDGDAGSGCSVKCSSRIDLGCAGNGKKEIAPSVWRPYQLCGEDVFKKVSKDQQLQIKACLASVFDCMQVA
jgi:hypothetical protein